MADQKISELDQATSMLGTEVLPIVSGTTTKSISKANFLGGTNVSQVVGTTETQTLTNKTLTSPVLSSPTGIVLADVSDVTADAAEINKLDGLATTKVELGYVDGVTSAIQTQMNLKAPLSSPTLVTPTLGVATATSINKVTITAPATSATLTIAQGSSLITAGAYAITLTSTNTTGVTLPTTGTLSAIAGTETLTNKRITKRCPSVTQAAEPAINTDNTDVAHITGLAQAITSFTTNLTGTPVEGDTLRIDITDNGTARAITWGDSFESSGNTTLPATTVLGVRLDVGFIWNTVTSKWRCVAVA